MIRNIKKVVHFLNALLACLFYRFPAKKLVVIGVTGTSGKTTTAYALFEVLKAGGKKVSVISTVGGVINGRVYDTGFHVTTPTPWMLQRFLRQAKDGGSEYFILEITSHALDQYRTWGSNIQIAVIVNIVREHLDYHKTIEDYRNAKARILDGVQWVVLNKDDTNYHFLRSKLSPSVKLITFGIKKNADLHPSKIQLESKLIGDYNLYNFLAASAVGKILGISEKQIKQGINNLQLVPGRMEELKTKKNFRIFIDFAHKPDALKAALTSLRKMTKNKLIIIFGCAGLRDRQKRPMMGEIAGKLADYVVLTAEDPRTEDVRVIIEEIAKGNKKTRMKEADKKGDIKKYLLTKEKYFWRIPDRQEAINFAIRKLARRGDLLLVTGKGHEQSMCYGKVEYPWDEKKAILKALYGTIPTNTAV